MSWQEIMKSSKKNRFANFANGFPSERKKNHDESIGKKILRERGDFKNGIYSHEPRNSQIKNISFVGFDSQNSQNSNSMDSKNCKKCRFKAVYSDIDIRCAFELLTTGKRVSPTTNKHCPLEKNNEG